MGRWTARAAACVLVAFALTLVALLLNSGRIVQDLETRAAAVVAPEAMSWATVEITGRDAALSGAAPSEELRRLAAARVGRLFGVRSVDADDVALLPETIPYVITLSRNDNVLTIAGSAPSAPDRRRMVDALTKAVPNFAYNDRLKLARGAPERGFPEALAALYPLLGEMANATISLSDQEIAIEGEAASNGSYERLKVLPRDLPAGFRVTRRDIVRPVADPYLFSAELGPASVTLSGFASDPDTRNALLGTARRIAGDRPVRDTVDLASGAPGGFAAAALEAVDFLGLMASGRIDVAGGVISIRGVAKTPEAYRTVNAYLDTWKPAGFTVESAVDLPVVSPYTLTVVRNGDNVTVSGFVPSAEVQEGIREAAARVAGLRGAVVETTMAAGAPDGFAEAARFGIELMQHLSSGSATLADDRLVVSGAARTGAHLLDLEAKVASASPPGMDVDVRVTPPLVAPYVWTMEKGADGIVLSGYVPSEQARTRIRELSEVAAGDIGVADRTQLAGGLPQGIDLEAVAAFAARQLGDVEAGRVTLQDDVLSLSGRTENPRAAAEVISRYREALPAGTVAGTLAMDAPPLLQFRIERGLDALSIQGAVVDEAARDRVLELVARSFGKADVEVTLEEAADLPEGATEAVLVAIRAASLLESGTVIVSGPTITVQGRAFTGVGATRLSADVAGAVPRGFRLDTSVGVARRGADLSIEECQAQLSELQDRSTLYFVEGAAALADESHGLLDRLAQILQRCRDAGVAVEAVTSATGDEALWRSRAEALAALLESTGVEAGRMEASAIIDTAVSGDRIVVKARSLQPESGTVSPEPGSQPSPEGATTPPAATQP